MPNKLTTWPVSNALRKRWTVLTKQLKAAGQPFSLAALHRHIPSVPQSNINRALQPLGTRPSVDAAAQISAAMDSMEAALRNQQSAI